MRKRKKYHKKGRKTKRPKRRKKPRIRNKNYEKEIVEKITKIKMNREPEKRPNYIVLFILLFLLLVLMYIGSSIKGNFIMTKCIDTDYGRNYNVYGEVTFIYDNSVYTSKDECIDDKILSEKYCDNGHLFEDIHTCTTRCNDGVCIE